MAQVTTRITIFWRWWARPYLAAVITAAWLMRPVVDDAALCRWSEREAEFVARRGLRCVIE